MTSEVARLRAQIAAEYEAGRRALHSLASGTARHDFITRRMEAMGRAHQQLEALLGREHAIELVAETLKHLPD